MLLKTTLLSGLIMTPRELKAEPTTMPLDIVPASLSESSGRCSLTKQNLTSNKRSVYHNRQILKQGFQGALLKLPFLPETKKMNFWLIYTCLFIAGLLLLLEINSDNSTELIFLPESSFLNEIFFKIIDCSNSFIFYNFIHSFF